MGILATSFMILQMYSGRMENRSLWDAQGVGFCDQDAKAHVKQTYTSSSAS